MFCKVKIFKTIVSQRNHTAIGSSTWAFPFFGKILYNFKVGYRKSGLEFKKSKIKQARNQEQVTATEFEPTTT